MRRCVFGLAVLLLTGCDPARFVPADSPAQPPTPPTTLAELGHEPPLDPNLVYDDDPGMGCYPTDVRTGERVDVCVWVEP